MFQLFQKRDFSSLVSDTFTFLKLEGKNYFKHFFKLCGIPLFLILVMIYLLADIGISSAVTATQYTGHNPDAIFLSLFQEHLGTTLLAIFGLLIVAFVLSIICYSFPVFYFKNIAESTKESLNQGIIGNVFIFYIITTMITVIPSFIIQFLILGGGMLFDPSNPEALLLSAAFKWGIVLLYFVYILLGTFGQNLMFMNLGIVYYSEREKEENFFTKRKIDSIGSTNA